MDNNYSFLSMPTEAQFLVLDELSLRELFDCEETCKDLNGTISVLFYHNKKEIEHTFEKKHPIFQIKCDKEKLKKRLAKNKFFSTPPFKKFINNTNLNFALNILPLCLGQQNMVHSKILEDIHPVFDEKKFSLFDKYGFSHNLSRQFANTYHSSPNQKIIFENLCKFLEATAAPYTVSLEENMYDALFKGFVQKLITSLKMDLQNNPLGIEALKTDLKNFDPSYILESKELKNLEVFDKELQFIENGGVPGCTLSKPHVNLEGRVRTECFNALSTLLDDLV